MVDDSTLRLSFIVASFVVVSLFASWYRKNPLVSPTPLRPPPFIADRLGGSQLDAIPTVGFSDPVLSYFSALRFFFDSLTMLNHGYEKTGRGLFKIPTFRRWMVLASGPELIEDVRKAPEDVLSSHVPRVELLQSEYTMGSVEEHEYHVDVVRSKLTRNLAVTFNEIRDELVNSLDASIPLRGDDWVKVPITKTVQRVICATSNRVFVGTPLCRDKGYQDMNLGFAVNIMKIATIISMFPKPLKPIVARLISNIPSQIQQVMEFIRPMVEERFAKMEEFGEDWDDKPNDMLMWLMSEAKGVERSPERLARRLIEINFASIHTTSLAFTSVLFNLLSNPEYIEPLRHDVEIAVAEEGWTKAGMDKMRKVDSFLRESQRLNGPGILSLTRLAIRPFTFSNGVTVPAGTLIATPSTAVHRDGEIYPNPKSFDGFRFTQLRERNGVPVAGQQATSTSAQYLTFGYGRLACPGRFFAASEIKALLAHILVTYDIKFEEGKQAPRTIVVNSMRLPRKANVMFRKRQK